MRTTTFFSGIIAFLVPFLLAQVISRLKREKNWLREIMLYLALFGIICAIVYLTLGRNYESKQHQAKLMPFWSYVQFARDEIRWQVYMNIFLFIPFGFLLTWVRKLSFFPVLLIGCAFSVIIEVSQYIFCLGLCEVDDVIHNILGTAIGYGYWRFLHMRKMCV